MPCLESSAPTRLAMSRVTSRSTRSLWMVPGSLPPCPGSSTTVRAENRNSGSLDCRFLPTGMPRGRAASVADVVRMRRKGEEAVCTVKRFRVRKSSRSRVLSGAERSRRIRRREFPCTLMPGRMVEAGATPSRSRMIRVGVPFFLLAACERSDQTMGRSNSSVTTASPFLFSQRMSVRAAAFRAVAPCLAASSAEVRRSA